MKPVRIFPPDKPLVLSYFTVLCYKIPFQNGCCNRMISNRLIQIARSPKEKSTMTSYASFNVFLKFSNEKRLLLYLVKYKACLAHPSSFFCFVFANEYLISSGFTSMFLVRPHSWLVVDLYLRYIGQENYVHYLFNGIITCKTP